MSPSTPIRLVALDLDGTLLNSQSQISPRTRQAIADAVGRRVPYTAVTPMRPGVRPMNRFCWSVIVCPRKPPGKCLPSTGNIMAH